MSEVETAGNLLHKAARLVTGDRADQNGSMVQNFAGIAAIWNGILAAAGKAPPRPLDGHDVATLMEGMKIARRYTGAFHTDDYLDGAGYAACAFEVRRASHG